MSLMEKSDLHYKDYKWTAIEGDDPKVTGKPDRTFLNRNEGYEILYFINKLSEIFGLKKMASATKMEKMIREELPGSIRSQENIKKWIEENWETSKL